MSTKPAAAQALSIYYKGIPIHFTSRDLTEYKALLLSTVRDGHMTTSLELRTHEAHCLRGLCEQILGHGADALDTLLLCEDRLPREHLLQDGATQSYELVSRTVDPVIRGLIDPRLRTPDWSHAFAKRMVSAITQIATRVNHEPVHMFTLNADATHSLTTLIEDIVQ